jgi:hypothetical protein
MANKTLQVRMQLTYVDALGVSRVPSVRLSVPYMGTNEGTIDVPDLEAGATTHAIPFGAVAEATAVLVVNQTANGANPGQDINIKVNGGSEDYSLPPGGAVMIAGDMIPSDTPIASIDAVTTDAQAGPGEIAYFIFGDPV